ncbi:DUF1330 domain-containing protein [Vibrio ouci]|uniref:DUF1330 domain-containing protein n=1 Tax=Vibrio ouci TaxID=2499078 RepID=A0A4Y8WL07_9VIBR|nr:DUF1330 domain-containing protein [Vibrio ouci]TFH93386.1 DUF1330 domain-containing protein [Vibrio ouci]
MTSYYSVIEVTPTQEEWIPGYIGPATQLVHKHGGKYLARTATHERVEGDRDNPALRVIIEWPSKQAALDFMSDPEYAPHLKARTDGSISHHALVEGKDDMA